MQRSMQNYINKTRVRLWTSRMEGWKLKIQEEVTDAKKLLEDGLGTLPKENVIHNVNIVEWLKEEFDHLNAKVCQYFDKVKSHIEFVASLTTSENIQAALKGEESQYLFCESRQCRKLCKSFSKLVFAYRQYVMASKGSDSTASLDSRRKEHMRIRHLDSAPRTGPQE